MTVRELIAKLRAYPDDAVVAWADHDQDESEINARVGSVESFDAKTSFDPEYCKGVAVVLRPR